MVFLCERWQINNWSNVNVGISASPTERRLIDIYWRRIVCLHTLPGNWLSTKITMRSRDNLWTYLWPRERPRQLYRQPFILKHINTMLIHSHGLQREEPWRIINRDSRTELFIPDSSKNGQLRCAAIPGRVVLSRGANKVKTNVGA